VLSCRPFFSLIWAKLIRWSLCNHLWDCVGNLLDDKICM
jgi:hypothetical protein